jgi:hypothetical protein
MAWRSTLKMPDDRSNVNGANPWGPPRVAEAAADRAGDGTPRPPEESAPMLWTLIVILLILWLLGAFVRPVGGLIHVLLVIALVLLIFRLI